MNFHFRLFLCLTSLFYLFGCTSAQFSPSNVNKTYPSRRSADEIEVYKSQPTNKKFIEIGIVNACCTSNSNKLVDSLREQAANSGGDAIISVEPYAGGGISAAVIRFE
jgi:hypothetical protein